MKRYKILNSSNNTILLEDASLADSYFTRLKGLLGKSNIKDDEGLIIKPCNSVHTIGMNFSIDIAFVDKNNIIIHIIKDMVPGKLSSIVRKSFYVIEAKGGSFEGKVNIGDQVNISEKL